MDYVFLSYSRQDREFADRLSHDLRAAGVNVWRDVDSIKAGDQWDEALTRGLLGATAILVLASAASAQSEWVLREIEAAFSQRTLIIPVIFDDSGAATLPPRLRTIQWADLRVDYQRGLRLLVDSLPSSVKADHPLEARPRTSKGYVFISYADEDATFAGRLRGFLKDRGYGYWDYRESPRNYHTELDNELESIIKEAAATLSVLSPDWKKSRWTRREYVFSEEVDVPVFLLRVRPTEPTLLLAGMPYIDFVDDVNRGFAKLDERLKSEGLI